MKMDSLQQAIELLEDELAAGHNVDKAHARRYAEFGSSRSTA